MIKVAWALRHRQSRMDGVGMSHVVGREVIIDDLEAPGRGSIRHVVAR
jgi:hypothetical protein